MPSSLKPMTVASAHHGQVRVRSGVELLTRQSVGGGSVDRLSVGPTTAGTRRAAARIHPGERRILRPARIQGGASKVGRIYRDVGPAARIRPRTAGTEPAAGAP